MVHLIGPLIKFYPLNFKIMKKSTSFKTGMVLAFMLSSILYVNAQQQAYNWYFGNQAGMQFVNGAPNVLLNGQTPLVDCSVTCHSEGTSVMSDSTGSLLFYTNGEKVWNKNHQVMANGNGLLGYPSSTQAALIVPKPGSKRYYYIFTTPGFQANFSDGLRYTMVDMCADNGYGDVVVNQKNIKVMDTIAEKLTGVIHTNGLDYWIITHKFWSRSFYAFHLTSAGITNTVVSTLGFYHPSGQPVPTQNRQGAIGQMKASPNGQKLVVVAGNSGTNCAEYYDFNASTGVVSNSVNIHPFLGFMCGFYGASFSPDNTKLYISTLSCGSATVNNGIYQYDLTRGGGQPDSVKNSKLKITNSNNPYLGLQLATNGKIYSARGPIPTHQYLGAINNPNVAGLNCNYQDSAVNLNGRTASYGLPNFIDSFRYLEVQTANDGCISPPAVVGIKENSIGKAGISPNPFSSFIKISTGGQESPIEFKLFDLLGKQVYSTIVPANGIISMETSGIAAGIYYYHLKESGSPRVIQQGKICKE
jgi:hypothetical protein